jgi:hypothetical protein
VDRTSLTRPGVPCRPSTWTWPRTFWRRSAASHRCRRISRACWALTRRST